METAIRFPLGLFKGKGHWRDRKGDKGDFTSELDFIEQADHARVQITSRQFFKSDGSLWYVENSRVILRFFESQFVEVTIEYGEATTAGQGYWFDDFCHYDMDVAEDNHIENTYCFSDGKIELLGSATNKGNLTIWAETLQKVDPGA